MDLHDPKLYSHQERQRPVSIVSTLEHSQDDSVNISCTWQRVTDVSDVVHTSFESLVPLLNRYK
jgi:hypothetical protein